MLLSIYHYFNSVQGQFTHTGICKLFIHSSVSNAKIQLLLWFNGLKNKKIWAQLETICKSVMTESVEKYIKTMPWGHTMTKVAIQNKNM